MADVVFSVCAGAASLAVTLLAAAKGTYVVAAVWGVVAVGFAGRAAYGWRRRRR